MSNRFLKKKIVRLLAGSVLAAVLLLLIGGGLLFVSGWQDTVTFEEDAVILKTALGTLVIQGRELQLKTLLPEGGQVEICGHIGAMIYEEPRDNGGFFRRLWG